MSGARAAGGGRGPVAERGSEPGCEGGVAPGVPRGARGAESPRVRSRRFQPPQRRVRAARTLRPGDPELPARPHPAALPPSVSQATLLRLYHRFRALDSNKKGYLR